MTEPPAVKNYRELKRFYPPKRQMHNVVRDMTIFVFSTFSKMDSSKEWIRFPAYHHVFDDEISGLKRHLRYFKNHGDLISLDAAVEIFDKKERIGGRYFCISFDDGFKNCISNALPVLVEERCQAAFFIPTDYIGSDLDKDRELTRKFFSTSADAYPLPVEFLNWDDCRRLLEAGMVIGSHTCGHMPLTGLGHGQLRSELTGSKQKIEEELKVDCRHFCCPWGRPGRDFRVPIDPDAVKEAGYNSFLTAQRGPNFYGQNSFRIKRDQVLAGWGDYQLRYFFSK